MKLQERLYHATTPMLIESIREHGLRPEGECIYLATDLDDAFRFAITYRTSTDVWENGKLLETIPTLPRKRRTMLGSSASRLFCMVRTFRPRPS